MKTLKRRKSERKTDYGKRIKLLKSRRPRIVFRRSNRYLTAQYVVSDEARDKIIFGINSKELVKYGWPEKSKNLKSIPASYLLGFMAGKKILTAKLEMPVADFGMLRALHKTRIYAFLKGLIESGIKIECKKELFPSEERIKGDHLKNKIPFTEIKSKIDKL